MTFPFSALRIHPSSAVASVVRIITSGALGGSEYLYRFSDPRSSLLK